MSSSVIVPGSRKLGHEADPIKYIAHEVTYIAEDVRSRSLEYNPRHHRGMCVEARAIGRTATGKVRKAAAVNQNYYPGQNPTKHCAEPQALYLAIKQSVEIVDFIVVSGTNQPDTQSGKLTPTLNCCGVCRCGFCKLSQIKVDTALMSFDNKSDIVEIYNPAQLNTIHSQQRFVPYDPDLHSPEFSHDTLPTSPVIDRIRDVLSNYFEVVVNQPA